MRGAETFCFRASAISRAGGRAVAGGHPTAISVCEVTPIAVIYTQTKVDVCEGTSAAAYYTGKWARRLAYKGFDVVAYGPPREAVMEIRFNSVIPVLRIFNIAKADEFYLGFLGFNVDWDHRVDPIAPLCRQISRGNLILHLSEHHGDGSPGIHIRVMMDGVEAFQREISSKDYPYMKPETMPWECLRRV
jgi:hypothetical protein